MVLKIQVPNGTSFTRLIEGALPHHYGVKQIPLSRYMTDYSAAALLDIKKEHLLSYIAPSHTIHAILLDDILYVHPDGVKDQIRRKYRKAISREVRILNPRRLP